MPDELIERMNEHVSAIHPDLDWETGQGRTSEHHLCLSGVGDARLRLVAERWLRRAPPADDTWEFHAARQPGDVAGGALTMDGKEVDFDRMTVAITIDEEHERMNVVVYHPMFSAMPERLRTRFVFLALDNALGEDDVERWVGSIDAVIAEPPGVIDLADLPARVQALAETSTGESWAVLRGEREGRPIFVTVNRAIKRVDHLMFDQHTEVVFTLLSPSEDGLTESAEADELNLLEDRLLEALGDHAVYIGRETWNGRRSMHLHVMDSGPAAAIIDRFARSMVGREVSAVPSPDPQWEVLQRWG